MNRNFLLSGILILIILVGGVFVFGQQKQSKETSSSQNEISSEDVVRTNSSYIPYSKGAYDKEVNKKRVLYFYANWCPICRPLDEELSQTDRIPAEIVILRVNFNDSDTDEEEKELAKKYKISYQHTFVQVDEDGNEIAKWSGGSVDEIISNIN